VPVVSGGSGKSLIGPIPIAFNTLGLGDPHGARLALIPAGTLVRHVYLMLSTQFVAGTYELSVVLFVADFSDSFQVSALDVGSANAGNLSSPTKAIFETEAWSGALAPVNIAGLALVDCDLRVRDLTGGATQGACRVYIDAVSVA
jgi:hypothetical protein